MATLSRGWSSAFTPRKISTIADNQWEYVEVKGGLMERFLGHGYYLIPMELCTVDHERSTVRASVDEDTVKNSKYLEGALDLSQRPALGVRNYHGL